jgi:hypothetical protein
MHKMFDLYLMFPQGHQSEAVQKHAFAALRAFITKVRIQLTEKVVVLTLPSCQYALIVVTGSKCGLFTKVCGKCRSNGRLYMLFSVR